MDSSARPLAIVTGASSGLGLTFADKLAERGHDVVLVARSAERLQQGAARIASHNGVTATPLALDLTDPAAWAELQDRVPQTDLLVNSAGFASFGDFVSVEPERLLAQVTLNCTAPVALTRAYLPGMLERDSGGVINVASTAAFQPVPTMAVYAASKAFLASFTAALWDEVLHSRVRVLGVCPGPTHTGFFRAGGDETVLRHRRNPDDVVSTALEAFDATNPLVVDGRGNSFLAALSKIAPTRMQLPIARWAVRPAKN